jgi:hypothetical protein
MAEEHAARLPPTKNAAKNASDKEYAVGVVYFDAKCAEI